MVVGTQKAKEMSQTYYSRAVDENQIQNLIENLPFTEISPSQ
jgi:hypothetical protein